MLRTPVCDVLGIEAPVVQGGMGPLTSAELVAAVSNAGGLGILGALRRPAGALRAEIHRIRELTDRPFGVNHVIAQVDQEGLEVTFEEQAPVLSLAWGDPSPYVERACGGAGTGRAGSADGDPLPGHAGGAVSAGVEAGDPRGHRG
jgi:NAD(P)H-dependent flavin oxidoreductase YrpB (nitropropane dioxygenase family)